MKTTLYSETIQIPIENKSLIGELVLPEQTDSILLFSQGSGSNRFSAKNRYIAELMHKNNIGTLLFDLLTPDEDIISENRENIPLLTKRFILATEFIQENSITESLKLAYFGSGTGVAPALVAAADYGYLIKAVAVIGGNLEVVTPILPEIKAATMLLVGSLDEEGLVMNSKAYKEIKAPKQIGVIEGASYLYDEPEKLDDVAKNVLWWLERYLKEN